MLLSPRGMLMPPLRQGATQDCTYVGKVPYSMNEQMNKQKCACPKRHQFCSDVSYLHQAPLSGLILLAGFWRYCLKSVAGKFSLPCLCCSVAVYYSVLRRVRLRPQSCVEVVPSE